MRHSKNTQAEKISYAIILFILFLCAVVTVYPFWYTIMYALSDSRYSSSGGLFLWPKHFSLKAIIALLQSKSLIRSYLNTIYLTAIGTAVSLIMTAMLAYPLSVKRIHGRNLITMFVFFTMLFSGGMIPNYLLIRSLGLMDNYAALILPGMIGSWNMFLMRNYFQSIPAEMEESARVDGSGAMRTLLQIILPISLPVFATIGLFYALGYWNMYFSGVLYLTSASKQTLQMYLRQVVASNSVFDQLNITTNSAIDVAQLSEDTMGMAAVVASIVPMLIVYPFIQRYYVKGIMVGSIKG